MLKYIILGLMVYYIYTGYSFLNHMEKIKCSCATEHKDFQGLKLWIKIVIGSYVIGLIFGGIALFKVKYNLKNNLPLAGVFLFLLVLGFFLNLGRVYYARKMDLFSNYLAQTKCKCSKNSQREFNRFFSILSVIYHSLNLFILFLGLVNFKKLKPFLKMASQMKLNKKIKK